MMFRKTDTRTWAITLATALIILWVFGGIAEARGSGGHRSSGLHHGWSHAGGSHGRR